MKKLFKKLKGLNKKQKILTTIVALMLVAAVAASAVFASAGKKSSQSYSFVRTTTLEKGTLEDSISATGTVSSAKTSKVTTNLNYTVKEVNVSVGDEVKKGDTLITLDSSELEKQIEKEEENLSKAKSTAQTQYNNASSSYNKAKSKLSSYASTLSSAESAYNTAKTPYDNAVASLKSYQTAYDKALSDYNTAGSKYIKRLSEYNSALAKYKNGSASASELLKAAGTYINAVQNYLGGCDVGTVDISDSASSAQSNASDSAEGFSAMASSQNALSTSVSVTQSADDICKNVISEVYTLTGTTLVAKSGSNTLYKLGIKAQALRDAKTACNYSSVESAYKSAKTAYDQAKTTNSQYKTELSQAKTQLTQAKKDLESASSSDTLTELKSQLDECKLKTEQDGTVTALSATVGSTCNMDAAATVQDLSSLQVDITIAEADINNAKIGQTCHITDDASDETLDGKLTQIDPTSDNGSFGATVTINTSTNDLHIGMNASVSIIVSSSENVYQVPVDAVGDDNDTSFVYRKTSGEGTDMQFEKVTVTTGNSNDYYIEISSTELNEGDVVRSSADLSEGIETVSSDSDSSSNAGGLFGGLFGGMSSNKGGGDMPTPPSGDFPGGSGSSSSSGSGSKSSGDMPSPPSGGFSGGGQNG